MVPSSSSKADPIRRPCCPACSPRSSTPYVLISAPSFTTISISADPGFLTMVTSRSVRSSLFSRRCAMQREVQVQTPSQYRTGWLSLPADRCRHLLLCGDTCVVHEGCHRAKQDGDTADCEGQISNHLISPDLTTFAMPSARRWRKIIGRERPAQVEQGSMCRLRLILDRKTLRLLRIDAAVFPLCFAVWRAILIL